MQVDFGSSPQPHLIILYESVNEIGLHFEFEVTQVA